MVGDLRVGLKFGLPSVRKISEAGEKYDILSKDGGYNALGIAHVLFAGYCNNQLVKEQINHLALVDFVDVIEEAFVLKSTEPQKWESILQAMRFFADSFVVKSVIEDAKKKTQQTAPPPKSRRKSTTTRTGTGSKPSATGNSDSAQTSSTESPGEST